MSGRVKGIAIAAALAGLLSAGGAFAATDCAALRTLPPPANTTILSTEAISAGTGEAWRTPSAMRPAVDVRSDFCRVVAEVHPTSSSSIHFELWLPVIWNGRFFGTASGGSAGSIDYHALVGPLARGFAAMGHDNGHVSSVFDLTWAFDEKAGKPRYDKIDDYAWRAQHVATVAAKALTTRYYAKAPVHSYYVGCSQGGHHGQMESQRFPEDYDGIVAGSSGGDWVGMMTSEAWAATVVTRDNRVGGVKKDLLPLVARQVLASCDGVDGLADGQIEDPERCKPNFEPIRCRPGQSGGCLSDAQITAIEAIYAGPRDAATGRQLAPGYSPGSEANWGSTWNAETQPHSGSYFDFYRLLVHQDPTWELKSFVWPQDVDRAREEWDGVYGALNADLTPFETRGGKLILFHGLADPLMPAGQTLHYWDRLDATMGHGRVDRFARLFLIPAMAHCGGGPLGEADWLTAISTWVETGTPPDPTTSNRVVGYGKLADGTLRRRAYCPFPMVAKYRGSGDINGPEAFACTAR